MKDSGPDSLDARLARLARDIAPPKNLWPIIVHRIARMPRAAFPMAIAAAAAAACLATALAWVVLHGRTASTEDRQATIVAKGFDEPRDPGYLAARAALQQTFRDRLALLDPRTRAQIESSLAVIHRARADLRGALALGPESPVLQQLLESTWHDELDLYDDLVRATQPTLARN